MVELFVGAIVIALVVVWLVCFYSSMEHKNASRLVRFIGLTPIVIGVAFILLSMAYEIGKVIIH